jgi:hypothetical protein
MRLPFGSILSHFTTPTPLPSNNYQQYYHMSDVSKLNIPYLTRTRTRATGEEEVKHTELQQNQAFRALDDEDFGRLLCFTPSCKETPTIEDARQLDSMSGSGRFRIPDDTVFTLVTEKGPETLVAPFHFITNANNEVIFPDPEAPSYDLEAPSCDLEAPSCDLPPLISSCEASTCYLEKPIPSCEAPTRYLGPPPPSGSGPAQTLVQEMMIRRGMLNPKKGTHKLPLLEQL